MQRTRGQKYLVLTLIVFGLVGASRIYGTRPQMGVLSTASVGSTVFERFNYSSIPAVKLGNDFHKPVLFGSVSAKAGDLIPITRTDRRLVACIPDSQMGCLIGTKLDGNFDHISNEIGAKTYALKQPLPYTKTEMPTPSAEGTFRQTLSYSGRSGDSLKFLYREFLNDMAGPAFTQELTYQASASFPDEIVFRHLHISAEAITNAGLRYRILNAAVLEK